VGGAAQQLLPSPIVLFLQAHAAAEISAADEQLIFQPHP